MDALEKGEKGSRELVKTLRKIDEGPEEEGPIGNEKGDGSEGKT